MSLSVHSAVEWGSSLIPILSEFGHTLIQQLRNLAEKKSTEAALEMINELEKPLSDAECQTIFSRLVSFGLKDSGLWNELISGVQHQLDNQRPSVLIAFIESVQNSRSPLYNSLGRIASNALSTPERQQEFVNLSKLLLEKKPEMIGSILYILRVLLFKLQEDHKAKELSQILRLVHNQGIIKLCNENCIKNAQRLLELLLKEALLSHDSEFCTSVLSTIDDMTPKPQDIFFNKLLDFISKSGLGAKFSEQLLGVMIRNKVKASLVTFNTLLDLYISQRNFQMANYLFDSLQKNRDPGPDSFTFCIMISGVKHMRKPDSDRATELFNMYKEKQRVDLIVVNCLLDVYISLGQKDLALKLVSDLTSQYELKPDEVTFNTLIKDSARRGALAEAELQFEKMKSLGLKPSRITYNSLMDICSKGGDLAKALSYLKQMQASGTQPDQYSYAIVFNGLKTNVSDKRVYTQTFAHLENLLEGGEFTPDEICFNTMMDVAAKFEDIERVESLFKRMKTLDIKPGTITYGILIKAYGKVKDSQSALATFEEMKLADLEPNEVTYGCLVEALVNSGDLATAEKVWRELPGKKQRANPVLFSTMVKGYSRQGMFAQALSLFQEVKQDPNFRPNLVVYNVMLDVACKKSNLPLAREFMTELLNLGLQPDTVTYSVLIKGHCQEKSIPQAINLLSQMLREGVSPDLPIFNLLLEACADPTNFTYGFQVYSILCTTGIRPSPITFGTLVKLYGFKGCPEEAFSLINEMRRWNVEPSVIFFTNIIHISFSNRQAHLAEKAYFMMCNEGLQPDLICIAKLVQGFTRAKLLHKAVTFVKTANELGLKLKHDLICQLDSKLQERPLKGDRAKADMEMVRKLALEQEQFPAPVLSEKPYYQSANSNFNSANHKRPFKEIPEKRVKVDMKENYFEQQENLSPTHNQDKKVPDNNFKQDKQNFNNQTSYVERNGWNQPQQKTGYSSGAGSFRNKASGSAWLR
jgi:pentatricopeptide repeat protein